MLSRSPAIAEPPFLDLGGIILVLSTEFDVIHSPVTLYRYLRHYQTMQEKMYIPYSQLICFENAAAFTYSILKLLDLDFSVSIEASHTCSKPRLDAFGGAAAFVTKNCEKWLSTQHWLEKQASNFKKKKASRAA
jgi:hypothetical protein